MDKKIMIILFISIIGLLAGGGIAYYIWNKPHQNVADTRPEKLFTSAELYNNFKDGDTTLIARYNNKVIQVSGTIGNIAATDSVANIFLQVAEGSMDNISCAIDPQYLNKIKEIKTGDKIKLKGIFSGINKFEDADFGISTIDIVLTRCVPVKD